MASSSSVTSVGTSLPGMFIPMEMGRSASSMTRFLEDPDVIDKILVGHRIALLMHSFYLIDHLHDPFEYGIDRTQAIDRDMLVHLVIIIGYRNGLAFIHIDPVADGFHVVI